MNHANYFDDNTRSVVPAKAFVTPKHTGVASNTSLGALFSDDFGGAALDTITNWTVYDGGYPGIGSAVTGITDSVAGSALTVTMGTTANAERLYLSNQIFHGKEDILVILSRSQPLAANSIFIGLVEVDETGAPSVNPNLAGEFRNRGGCEFGLTATGTSFQAEAIGDASSAKAVGNTGVAGIGLSATQEYLIEIDSRDIIVSNALVDAVAPKVVGSSRVSTQCPNDQKLYKLAMRFANIGAPGSNTNVVIQRILVVDNFEMRVQVSSGEGDTIGAKSIGVNIAGQTVTLANVGVPQANSGAATFHKLTTAANTNPTSVKSSQGSISGGSLRNRAASERYFKLYNKASAPVVGTDIPVLTIGLPAASIFGLEELVGVYGARFSAGIAYAITGAYADADTTAIAAGDVDVNLIYT